MTTKAKADDKPAEETQSKPAAEPVPACGKPHYLPMLAKQGIACQLDAELDLAPGEPEHQHRHQDGDALYNWR